MSPASAKQKAHWHEQRTRAPMILMAIGIIGVLLVALQVLMFVQQRTAIRDAQNAKKDRQIAALKQEIADRDAAINKEITRRDERNRKATCAIISSIPPDGGVVDAFRKSLKCGPYKAPSTKKTQASKSAGDAQPSGRRSSTAQSATSSGSSTESRDSSSSPKNSSTAPDKGNAPTSPKPSPAPSPTSPPPADGGGSSGGAICLLGICLL